MAGALLRPPNPPSEDWSRTYDSLSDSSYESCSTSRSSDGDEERPGPASRGNTQPGYGRCCGTRAPAAPPSEAASEKDSKGKQALARTLRKVAAVHDDEVPTALWTKPSRALALERAEAHQPRFKATDGKWYAYDVTQTTAQQIGRALGAGYGAWFVQLEFMQLLFALLTLFAVPSMYFLAWAAARNDTQTHDLLGGRLLRWASYATLDSLSESHELGGEVSGLTSAGVAVIHTCLDVVATELFIIGLEYLRRRVRSSELVAGKGRGVVTLAPFSVVVEGLPRDIDDVDEIEDYFSRFGDVADVVLSTTATRLLTLEDRHAAAVNALEDFKAAVAKSGGLVHGKLQLLQAEVDACAADVDEYHKREQCCTCAFVTFEKAEAAAETLAALSSYEFTFGSAERFRGRLSLRVRRAPEAADILWENTCVKPAARAYRTVVASLVSLAVVGLAIWLVSWFVSKAPPMMRDVDCTQVVGTNPLYNTGRLPATLDCQTLFPLNDEAAWPPVLASLEALAAVVSPPACDLLINKGAFTVNVMTSTAAAVGDLVARGTFLNSTADFMSGSLQGSCAASVCYTCLCRERVEGGAGGGYGAGVTGQAGMCARYSDAFRGQDDLRYIIIGISLGAMILFMLVTRPLSAALERHNTRVTRETACAMRLAFMLFASAYLVPLLGYAINGRVFDFTDLWYRAPGAIILCNTIFLAVFAPLGIWLAACCHKLACRLARRPLRQAVYDAKCMLPPFRLAERYGVFIAVVFCALLISPGCPFVYPALQIYAFSAMRVDRHALLRLTSVPDPLNSALAERVMTVLPLSVWLHLFVGTWMLGAQTVPSYLMAWKPNADAELGSATGAGRFDLQLRLNRMNGLIFFVVFLVFSVWVAPLTFWLRKAACCCGDAITRSKSAMHRNSAAAASAGFTCKGAVSGFMRTRSGPDVDFSYAFRKKMLHGLPSYRLIDNPEYLMRISASGILSEDDLLRLQPYLKRRLRLQAEAAAVAAESKRSRLGQSGSRPAGPRVYAYPQIVTRAANAKLDADAQSTWWPFGGAIKSAKIPGFADAGQAGFPNVAQGEPPPPPVDKWTALHDRGEGLRASGRLPEAEACLRRAYTSRLRSLGELHNATVVSALALASVLQAQGRLADAEPLLRDSARARESALGALHPATLATANLLGSVLFGQSKHEEAELLFRRVLAGRMAAVGPQHTETAVAASNLGSCLYAQARLEEAEAMYRLALETRSACLPERHLDTLASAAALGTLLQARGGEARLLEAEELLRTAVRGRRAALGSTHVDVLSAVASLASVLQDRRSLGEAERLYAECLRGRRSVLGEQHPDTLAALNNLAACLADQGRLAQAEPLYAQALRGMTATLGASHPDTVAAARNLGALLDQLGALRNGAAPNSGARLVLLADKLRDLRLQMGSGHPETLTAANDLACALAEAGRGSDAEALFVEVLDARRASLGPGHPATLTSMNNLGRLRADQGALDEAELLLRSALKGRAHHFGAADPDTAVSARNLTEVLKARGVPDATAAVTKLIASAVARRKRRQRGRE